MSGYLRDPRLTYSYTTLVAVTLGRQFSGAFTTRMAAPWHPLLALLSKLDLKVLRQDKCHLQADKSPLSSCLQNFLSVCRNHTRFTSGIGCRLPWWRRRNATQIKALWTRRIRRLKHCVPGASDDHRVGSNSTLHSTMTRAKRYLLNPTEHTHLLIHLTNATTIWFQDIIKV